MSSIVKKIVFGGMAALALVIALSSAPSAKASVFVGGYGGRFIGAGCCNHSYMPHWGGYWNRGCGYGMGYGMGCGLNYGGYGYGCGTSSCSNSFDATRSLNINYSLSSTSSVSSDNSFVNSMY